MKKFQILVEVNEDVLRSETEFAGEFNLVDAIQMEMGFVKASGIEVVSVKEEGIDFCC